MVVAEPAGQTGSTVTAIDGRETAPAAATPERFLDAGGHPLPFDQALAGARAVGIPGSVAMLAEAHRRWGRLPWATLLAPAIRLAEYGTPVSHRLHTLSQTTYQASAQRNATLIESLTGIETIKTQGAESVIQNFDNRNETVRGTRRV